MLINNAVITGSFIVNGVSVTGITGSSELSSSYLALSSSYLVTSASYAVTSASYAQSSASLSIRTGNLEATSSTLVSASSSFAAQSASLSTRLTTDESNFTSLSSSFVTTSGSISSRVTTIEGQYATTGSNTFTGPQFINQASNAISFTSTASLYTDGGLRVAKDSFVSGTAYFNNITVYGTSSIEYITSSQVNIGSNVITVNTDTPAIRFGGLSVFDSGSTGLTGSLFWDSEKNHWIYSNPSGSSYNSAMLMNGPRNTGSLGDEQGTTNNALMKGQGGDHITSSQMIDDGTTVQIPGNLQVTGSLVGSSTVTATNGLLIGNGGATATSGYVPKFTGTSTIGNSTMQDDGTNVSITGGFTANSFLRVFKNGSDSLGSGPFMALYNAGATAAIFQQLNASNGLDWWTTFGKLMTLTSTGNLGLGVTPSAWSLGTALEIANGPAILGFVNETFIANNAYYNGGWKYRATATAQAYFMNGGEHKWQVAASGTAGEAITFTQAMTLNASGNLSIGNINNTYKLDVTGTARFTGQVNSETAFYAVATPPATNGGLINVRDTVTATNVTSFAGVFFNSSPGNDYSIGKLTENNAGFLQIRNANNGAELLRIASTGAATFSSTISAKDRITIISSAYPSNYYTSLRSDSSACGILQFGNNNDNYILAGNTAAGGYLIFRVNCASESITAGIEAMRISSTGTVRIGTAENAKTTIVADATTNYGSSIEIDGKPGSNSVAGAAYLRFGDNANAKYWLQQIDGSNQMAWWVYNAGWTKVGYQTTGGTWTNSDERRKENINLSTYGLNEVLQLIPKTFNFKKDERKIKDIGFIAQDVLPIIPDAVRSDMDGEEEYYAMNYSNLVPVLVKAIQELSAKVDAQAAEINELKNK